MKIRTGFVSNSSTTSFCIYGMDVEWDNLRDEIKKEFGEDYDCWAGELEGLECHCGECGDCNVGISWSDIKDDETGKEFKERIENLLKKYFKNVECYTIEEAYRDG